MPSISKASPSRMSVSDTSVLSNPSRRMTVIRITAPATITSPRPGAITGRAAFCVGVYPLTHDREILPVPRTQFDVGLHDIDAVLDHTSVRPCWEYDTVVGIADLEHHGEPVPWDARHVLTRALEPWQIGRAHV